MKHILILILLFFGVFGSKAQNVELSYNQTPLDEVLLDIREKYQVQFSFENGQLSIFQITVKRRFSDVDTALEFLFRDKPFILEKVGDTYLVYYTAKAIVRRAFLLIGNIVEKGSSETLPYAHLKINGTPVLANTDGWFSYKSADDSVFHIVASYLGFQNADTVVKESNTCSIGLTPLTYQLNEITVQNDPFRNMMTYPGNSVGEVQLSNYITPYLPGNGDNSVFNLLRLQPGILAAGEQSSDLLIWGSYEGQSQLLFDGMTLFAMKNYNDNISAVNPFLAKSVKVLKGAYGVEYNGFVGGIIDVTGLQGGKQKISTRLNINNQTLNGMISVPLFKKASLVMAARKTYYELYDQSSISFNIGRNESNTIDKILYPDYNFQDFNMKLSGESGKHDQFELNGFLGFDNFTYNLDLEGAMSNFQYEETEKNKQLGWSVRWVHQWLNSGNTRILFAGSQLIRSINNLQKIGNGKNTSGSSAQPGPDFFNTTIDDEILNSVSEQKLKIETSYANFKNHQLKWEIGFQNYSTSYNEDSLQILTYSNESNIRIYNAYINDTWNLGENIQLELGLLNEYAFELKRNDLQPRFRLGYRFNENIQFNFGLGLYRQYLTRLTQIDDFSTIRYFWMLADNEEIAIQNAIHNVLGLRYTCSGLSLNVELFHKKIQGLTRFLNYSFLSDAFNGNSYSDGFDILLEKRWDRVQFWTAYSYSRTYEYFDYFTTNEYQRALHDQRHELKLTLLINLKKWHLTSNYVYGSGFPDIFYNNPERDYHRLDLAVTRSLSYRRFKIDTGLSILNVFNYQNLKYDNFYRLPDETGTIELQAEAVPFTPTIFFNILF